MTKKENKTIEERFFEKVAETPFLINKLKNPIIRPWYVLQFPDYIFIPKEVTILICKDNQWIHATDIAKAYWIRSSKDYKIIDNSSESNRYNPWTFYILFLMPQYPKVIIY